MPLFVLRLHHRSARPLVGFEPKPTTLKLPAARRCWCTFWAHPGTPALQRQQGVGVWRQWRYTRSRLRAIVVFSREFTSCSYPAHGAAVSAPNPYPFFQPLSASHWCCAASAQGLPVEPTHRARVPPC